MNILIINCSPVRNGATAEIVNLVKEHVEEGNVVKSVFIDDYDIKSCKGCRKCHETAKCFQEDDVDKLMVMYDWADKIVSVSPSYWADIPGQFKVFIDRCKLVGFACFDSSAKGFFGPIGVRPDRRGENIGQALLIRTLNAMREYGYGYAIIGWVSEAENFYRKTVGAEYIKGGNPENSVYSNLIMM